MLHDDDLPFIEEPTIDEVSDLLRTLPEIRRSVALGPREEEGGLRSLLEQPEALLRARWRSAGTRSKRRAAHVLRAA
jgi:hypothetical protein